MLPARRRTASRIPQGVFAVPAIPYPTAPSARPETRTHRGWTAQRHQHAHKATKIVEDQQHGQIGGSRLRQEPSAVVPHAGICAEAARKGGPYRDPKES